MTTIDEFAAGLDIGADELLDGGEHPVDAVATEAAEPAPVTDSGEAQPATPAQGEAQGQGQAAATTGETAPQPSVATPVDSPARSEPTVPVATLVAERKAFRAELDAVRAERKTLEERLQKLEKPPEPPKPDPDFLDDPKGYVDAKLAAAVEKLDKLDATTTRQGEEAAAQQQFQAFASALQTDEAGFLSQTPDYHEALAHVRQVRGEQLRLMAPGASEEQIVNHLREEELAFAATQMQAGKSPAEAAYRFARTLGFAPKAPAATNGAGKPAPANAAQAAAAAKTLGASGGESAPAADPMADGLGDGLDALDMALRERFAR